MKLYIPKIGETFEAFHPLGLFTDNVIGSKTSQTYTVSDIVPDETYCIILHSKRGERFIISEVEPAWFDTDLTGRVITLKK